MTIRSQNIRYDIIKLWCDVKNNPLGWWIFCRCFGGMLLIIYNCRSSKKKKNERFHLNQLIKLTNSYIYIFILQLQNTSLCGLENYSLYTQKNNKFYLHVFLLYINVIISYSFKEKIANLLDTCCRRHHIGNYPKCIEHRSKPSL